MEVIKIKKLDVFILVIGCVTSFFCGYKYEEYNYEKTVDVIEAKVVEVEKKEYDVWTTANADVKKEPNIDGEVIDNYGWNTGLVVTYENENWAKIKDTENYISRDSISESQVVYTDYDVPSNNTIKSYMDYKAITSKSSDQYKLQQIATTEEHGIRKVNDRYCIALGSYYSTTIGQYIDIELENGDIIKGILSDCKDDKHTDSKNQIHMDGSVLEFVVDTDYLDKTVMRMGDVSHVREWNNKVVNIRVYDKVEEF